MVVPLARAMAGELVSGTLRFTVYGQPAPAGSKRGFNRGGRVVITDDNPRSRPWKAQVADAAAQAMNGQALIQGAVVARFTFTVVRPKGHYGKRGLRTAAPMFPTVKPDLLKLARAIEDAITGICYRDDAQIVAEVLLKRYGEPSSLLVELWDAQCAADAEIDVYVRRWAREAGRVAAATEETA